MIRQLGPYFIDEALAEGGMAQVFRARLRGPGGFEKQLVLKQIRPELARDPQFVELFVREANLLVLLSHPHIVQVYELGAVDGTYYISMEYVDGATVAQLLAQGALSPALTAHLGAQICEALDYAHGRFGILHRDITPRNIIVDEAGHARLLDFGIATTERAAACTWLGSPGYMAPEQVEREPLSPASDMFALGCVLHEALCGTPAFEKEVRATLGEPAALHARAELPESLTRLVAGLLSRAPAERPSAKDAARVLRAYLAQARPEGVLEEMQQRAVQARTDREKKAVEASASAADGVPQTAPAATRSIATSPALTEMLRSGPGLASPVREVVEAETRPLPTTAAKHAEGASKAPLALTRRMLQSWPSLAVLALGASLALAGQRGQREAEAVSQKPSTNAQAASAQDPPAQARKEHGAAPAGSRSHAEVATRAGSQADAGESRHASAGSKEAAALEVVAEAPAATRAAGTQTATATGTLAAASSVPLEGAETSSRATLSVNAVPWGEVRIDGRPHGTTPLRKLKLRPGVHRLSVRCPPLDRSAELTVELSPRADARVVVDLQRAPVRTFLDGAKEVR